MLANKSLLLYIDLPIIPFLFGPFKKQTWVGHPSTLISNNQLNGHRVLIESDFISSDQQSTTF